jgi:hypothetical protein
MKKSALFTILFPVLSALATACAVPLEHSDSESQDLSRRPTCGGFAGVQCAAGFACVIASSREQVADAAGHCVKVAAVGDEGGECAGFFGFACKAGLDCVIAPKDRGVNDAGGVCRAPVAGKSGTKGAFCGGFGGIKCLPGLTCAIAAAQPGRGDASGTCK